MTRRVTIDTNVLVVANCQNPLVTEDCVVMARECVAAISLRGTIFLDRDDAILQEYGGQIDAEQRPQDISARLLVWLRQNRFSHKRIRLVDLARGADGEYVNCPRSLISAGFDVSDRKFVAIARKEGIVVVNAVDSDWIDNASLLRNEGVQVDNICGCSKANWFAP